MKVKNRYFGLALAIILLAAQTNSTIASGAKFIDKTNDVIHVSANGKETGGITTHPEIDFIETEHDMDEGYMLFNSSVVDDINHYYSFRIWWDGKSKANYTLVSFGRGMYNSVKTYLINATTEAIIVNNNVSGIVIMADKLLSFTIPNSTLIAGNVLNDYQDVIARCDVSGSDEYYYDDCSGPDTLPGYTFVISFIGISITALIIYLVRRKKKSGK